MLLRFLLILFLFSSAFGYVDADLDGVDDSVDKCPGTPFDVLVNADGCPINEPGKFYIKLASSYSKDSNGYSVDTFLTFAFSKKNWYLSLTGNYTLKDFSGKSEIGDLYIFGSYIWSSEYLYIQPGISIKVPVSQYSNSFEYIPSILFDVYFSTYDIFLYGNYRFTDEDYQKDSYSLSVGLGNQLTDTFYISTSFDYSRPPYSTIDNENYLSIYISYNLTEKYVISLLYSYGLNEDALDHYIFGKISVEF